MVAVLLQALQLRVRGLDVARQTLQQTEVVAGSEQLPANGKKVVVVVEPLAHVLQRTRPSITEQGKPKFFPSHTPKSLHVES